MKIGMCRDLNLLLKVNYLDSKSTKDLNIICPLCKGQLHYVKGFYKKIYKIDPFLRHNCSEETIYCNAKKMKNLSSFRIYLKSIRRQKYKNKLLKMMNLPKIDRYPYGDINIWRELVKNTLRIETNRNRWIKTCMDKYKREGNRKTNILVNTVLCMDILEFLLESQSNIIWNEILHYILNSKLYRIDGSELVAYVIDLICSKDWINLIKNSNQEYYKTPIITL